MLSCRSVGLKIGPPALRNGLKYRKDSREYDRFLGLCIRAFCSRSRNTPACRRGNIESRKDSTPRQRLSATRGLWPLRPKSGLLVRRPRVCFRSMRFATASTQGLEARRGRRSRPQLCVRTVSAVSAGNRIRSEAIRARYSAPKCSAAISSSSFQGVAGPTSWFPSITTSRTPPAPSIRAGIRRR